MSYLTVTWQRYFPTDDGSNHIMTSTWDNKETVSRLANSKEPEISLPENAI